MKYWIFLWLFLVGLAPTADADTQLEIDHLLNFVAQTSCMYERNGHLHSGKDAREHIEKKYNHYRSKIQTAEDFILYAASKSMISGKPYSIHCGKSEAIPSSRWLLDELDNYRSKMISEI